MYLHDDFPSPSNTPTSPLPRPFLVTSLLGLVWGVAHVALKAPTLHQSSVGLPLSVAWVITLAAAWRSRDRPWLAPLAALLGIVSCYWLAIMHVGVEIPGTFSYWPQVAGTPRLLWDMAYAVLLCIGIVLGLANIWTVRALLHRPVAFGAIVSIALLAAGAAAVAADSAAVGHRRERTPRVALFAVIPAAIMLAPGRRRNIRRISTIREHK